MEKPEKENLSDVLSAIRNMVREETRAKFSKTVTPKSTLKAVKSDPVQQVASSPNVPAKILTLHPHMRAKKPTPKVIILDKNARVPQDESPIVGENVSIADPLMYEGLLRDMVREVVQEQLRGELGNELIGSIKRDMVLLLEKNR